MANGGLLTRRELRWLENGEHDADLSPVLLSNAAFGSAEELGKYIRDPEKFIANRRKIVFEQRDQVPFWVKLHGGKQLFENWENRKKSKSFELSSTSKEGKLAGYSGGGTQKIFAASAQNMLAIEDEEVAAIEEEDPYDEDIQEGAENMTQLRQSGTSGQDKYRVSVEFIQLTFGFFDHFHLPPKSMHGKPDVILPGTHADAQNISEGEDGYFIRAEHYSYKGKEVHRQEGQKAGTLMKSFRTSGLRASQGILG